MVERVELKIEGMYPGQPAPSEVYLIFLRKVHHEESAADRQSDDRSVPGDTAACCSVSEISI